MGELDADIMGEVGLSNNDRCAAVQRRISFGGPSERLAASPFVTTGWVLNWPIQVM